MAEASQKEKHKIHVKYRISFINEDTFDEVRRIRLSVFNVVLFISITLLISGALVASLIFYTPLREYVPGYPDSETTALMLNNKATTDSLLIKMDQQDLYLQGIRKVLRGDISEEVYEDTSAIKIKERILDVVKMQATQAELAFRAEIETEEQYNLGLLDLVNEEKVQQVLLFYPVRGVITEHFDPENKHFGIDLATKPNEHILAVAPGTIIRVDYSMTTGNTISIQHRDNLVSTYRHASSIYKKVGDKVASGEVIGVVGSTGSMSTGIHLHLELWRDGDAIDPETLIVF